MDSLKELSLLYWWGEESSSILQLMKSYFSSLLHFDLHVQLFHPHVLSTLISPFSAPSLHWPVSLRASCVICTAASGCPARMGLNSPCRNLSFSDRGAWILKELLSAWTWLTTAKSITSLFLKFFFCGTSSQEGPSLLTRSFSPLVCLAVSSTARFKIACAHLKSALHLANCQCFFIAAVLSWHTRRLYFPYGSASLFSCYKLRPQKAVPSLVQQEDLPSCSI